MYDRYFAKKKKIEKKIKYLPRKSEARCLLTVVYIWVQIYVQRKLLDICGVKSLTYETEYQQSQEEFLHSSLKAKTPSLKYAAAQQQKP